MAAWLALVGRWGIPVKAGESPDWWNSTVLIRDYSVIVHPETKTWMELDFLYDQACGLAVAIRPMFLMDRHGYIWHAQPGDFLMVSDRQRWAVAQQGEDYEATYISKCGAETPMERHLAKQEAIVSFDILGAIVGVASMSKYWEHQTQEVHA